MFKLIKDETTESGGVDLTSSDICDGHGVDSGETQTSRKVARICAIVAKWDVDDIEALLGSLLEYIGREPQLFKDRPADIRKRLYLDSLGQLLGSFRNQLFLSSLFMFLNVFDDLQSEPDNRDMKAAEGAACAIEEAALSMSSEGKRNFWKALRLAVGKI